MKYIKYSIFVIVILIITETMAFSSNDGETRTIEFSVGNEYMYIDKDQIKIERPYVTDSNTIMVPVRAVAEALGAEVDWRGDTEPYKVYIKCSRTKAVYTIGGSIFCNEKNTVLSEVPLVNENDTTMVPLDSIVEALGADIEYDKGDIKVERRIYSVKDKDIITNSHMGWSIAMPVDGIKNFDYNEDHEITYFDDSIFFIGTYPLGTDGSNKTIDEYYDEILNNNTKNITVSIEMNSDGDKYLFREYFSEGYVIEHLYQKNDIYYWLCAVAHSEEKVKYYEDLMKTFSLNPITGDNAIDLSIINSMANIE